MNFLSLFVLSGIACSCCACSHSPQASRTQASSSALQQEGSQTPTIPASPPGERLKEFLQAFGSKEDSSLRAFVAQFASSTQVKLTPEERLARLKSLREDKGPFMLLDIL